MVDLVLLCAEHMGLHYVRQVQHYNTMRRVNPIVSNCVYQSRCTMVSGFAHDYQKRNLEHVLFEGLQEMRRG